MQHGGIKFTFCFLIGGFFLRLAFQQSNFAEVKHAVSQADWKWLPFSLLCYLFSLSLRAQRWRILLSKIKYFSYGAVFRILFMGYALNNVLPARLGELFRADYLKRRHCVSRSAVLGSIALERLADGIIVLLLLLLGVLFLHLNNQSSHVITPMIWSGSLLFGGATLCFVLLGKESRHDLFRRVPLINKYLEKFFFAVGAIRSKQMITVFAYSMVIWLFEIFCFWALLRMVQVEFNFIQVSVLVGVMSLSVVMPSAPGFLGTMQYVFVLILVPFGYSAAQGITAATINQLAMLGTATVMGFGFLLEDYVLLHRIKLGSFFPPRIEAD